MCLVLIAHRIHPQYRLVVVANRDEYHARATAPACFWPEAPRLLAGRDLQLGGTWLGITRDGRYAALTNVRRGFGPQVHTRSRGALVRAFLDAARPAAASLAALVPDSADCGPFNLLAGTDDTLALLDSHDARARSLAPGLYALSNDRLGTPWPKVERARSGFACLLAGGAQLHPEPLLDLAHDTSPVADADLPATGVDREWERLLAPIFIVSPTYGTRSSTVVLITRAGHVTFVERTFDPAGGAIETRRFEFVLSAAPR